MALRVPLFVPSILLLHLLASATKTAHHAHVNAPLLENLLGDLGCGLTSCSWVTQLARAALQTPTAGLREVANFAQESGHVERDIQR